MDSKLAEAKREVEEKQRLAAIRLAQELAERTFPSPMAIGLSVAAMRFDINRVFITAGAAFEKLRDAKGPGVAGAFYACYKRGDFSRALSFIRDAGILPGIEIGRLDPGLHGRARNPKTGRVELVNPLQIVSKEELAAYIKKEIAKLGKTSSGWNACAAKLGGSESESRWKSTAVHGNDGGSVVIDDSSTRVIFKITNLRPLARKHLSPGQLAGCIQRARIYLAQLLTSS